MECTVKLEEPTSVTRKLTITVPSAEVDGEFTRHYNAVRKQAKVKGFRPGHVPMNMVKQMYGADVKSRVLQALLDGSYRKALVDQDLRPVGQPTIDTVDKGHLDIAEGQELTYIATIEILPKIELADYKGISLKKDKIEVKDKEIEDAVEGAREHRAELVPLEKPRAVKKGDYVDLKFDGKQVTDEGLKEYEGMSGSRVIEIGSNQFIPGFEDQVIGMKAGEEKTFRIKFPDDYGAKDLAGSEAEFTVTANELKQKKLPEVDDEFAQGMNYDDLNDMKAKIKEAITQNKEEQAKQKMRGDLLEQLVKANRFDLPHSLLQGQIKMITDDLVQNLRQQRATDDIIKQMLEKEQKNISKRADQQVRAGLILGEISDAEKVKVEKSDLDAEIKKMAAQMQIPEQEVSKYYRENPKQRENLEYRVREDKTVELILSQAKIK